MKITVPSGIPSGTYYLVACADGNNKVKELDETNNCLVSSTTIIVGIPAISFHSFDTYKTDIGQDTPNTLIYFGDDQRNRIVQYGGSANDILSVDTGAENDWIEQYGGGGVDMIIADTGTGNDYIYQAAGVGRSNLTVTAGQGDDWIIQVGGDGNDHLNCLDGDGDDYIRQESGAGNDVMRVTAGLGNDIVIIDAGPGG